MKVELSRLSEPQQEQVIEFARSLAPKLPKGMSGEDLAKLRGILPLEDAREIAEIIKRDFNQVDSDGW